MITLLLAVADAAPIPQEPIWLEPVKGMPRMCVSFIPSAGRFKGRDRRLWTSIRSDLANDRVGGTLDELDRLSRPHPAAASVRAATAVYAEQKLAPELREELEGIEGDACVHQLLALLALQEGEVETARNHVMRANALDPEQPDHRLLSVIVDPGDMSARGRELSSAADHWKDHAGLQVLAGRLSIDRGDWDTSARHLQRAFDLGVLEAGLPLFHVLRMNEDLEGYLSIAGTMGNLPVDAVGLEPGSGRNAEIYRNWLGVEEGQELLAVFHTSMGDLGCELFYEETAVTVANFVGLARGELDWTRPDGTSGSGVPLYDGTIFHRVIPEFMVQGGDPEGTGKGSPGYRFLDEPSSTRSFDGPGVLAMANSGPNSNGSQFFITDAATEHLDGRHTIFGQCDLSSQILVGRMAEVPTEGAGRPVEDIVIHSVEFQPVPMR